MTAGPRYIESTRTAEKTPLPTVTPLLRVTHPLPSNGYLSGSTILALSKYATIITPFKEFHLHRSQNAGNVKTNVDKSKARFYFRMCCKIL
jgi:hypothetical protein